MGKISVSAITSGAYFTVIELSSKSLFDKLSTFVYIQLIFLCAFMFTVPVVVDPVVLEAVCSSPLDLA